MPPKRPSSPSKQSSENKNVNKKKKNVPVNNQNNNPGLKVPGSNWEKFKAMLAESDKGSTNNSSVKKKNSQNNRNMLPRNNGNMQPQNNRNMQSQNKSNVQVIKKFIYYLIRLINLLCLFVTNNFGNKQQTTNLSTKGNIPQGQTASNKFGIATMDHRHNKTSMGTDPKNSAPYLKTNNRELLNTSKGSSSSSNNSNKDQDTTGLTKAIAIDCEMVGIGDGKESMLARVSIVNRYGHCLYDTFVKPREPIADFRTEVSGVRPQDLRNGQDFETVQKKVYELFKGRILVGHALHNDLAVLFISHPRKMLRDTARYKPFRKVTNGNTPSLKKLAAALLGISIQSGEHSSVEDARAAMQIYQMHKKEWEASLKKKRK
ncbi:RNA exonuclease 4 isoform X1 [Trichogramma pretiosum]|uniref:RNA exonuclease 4 isoform X1 n=1 Tax=Trichogramma pretiosum TaxID=7493 RepID=UPI0006C9CC7B|nr:RNA exonuclease 4 isoform X1 [Trichogramma pretiosum]